MPVIMLFFVLAGCSGIERKDGGPSPGSIDVSSIPNAQPRIEPRSKYGNPSSYEVFGKRYYVMTGSKGYIERGIASWYGNKFHGRRTSSGETYDMYAMTAAHRELPLPTYVEVTNLRNGRQVTVKVNDRGPFHENRIIDLSYTAAAKLGIIKTGTGLVEVRAVDPRARPMEGATIKVAEKKAISPRSGFYIQVGAFSDRINAVNLRNRLSDMDNVNIHISEAEVGGSVVHRVRIGPINEVEIADNIVAELGRYGIVDHHIVLE